MTTSLTECPARAALPGEMESAEELSSSGAPVRAVPAEAFVVIGRPSALANDNHAPAGSHKPSALREAFFLAILLLTVIGAFWTGRMHGYQKVIVVPGPSSFYSVVT